MKKIHFLDLVIKFKDERIIADLYWKTTDSHQHLHYDLCQPEHVKRSLAFSQIHRLKKIYSKKSDLDSHMKELKNWFSKRVIKKN